MDTYLPADFHRLHDAAAEYSRDAARAPFDLVATTPAVRIEAQRERERNIDPGWLAL